MRIEILEKKLEQIKTLIKELEDIIQTPLSALYDSISLMRAAERDFQLIVDLCVDINTQLLIEKTGKTPDTYKQSFLDLGRANIISQELSKKLSVSAEVRNILVHEYDIDTDPSKFYETAQKLIPAFREYFRTILKSLNTQPH